MAFTEARTLGQFWLDTDPRMRHPGWVRASLVTARVSAGFPGGARRGNPKANSYQLTSCMPEVP